MVHLWRNFAAPHKSHFGKKNRLSMWDSIHVSLPVYGNIFNIFSEHQNAPQYASK